VDRAQSGREDDAIVIHDEARLCQRRAFEGWAAARHHDGGFAQGDDSSGGSGSASASDEEDMFLEDDKDMPGVRCRMQMLQVFWT
jgi:hypothetical protein